MKSETNQNLKYSTLLMFFLPLWASAFLLGLTGNLLNAGLARLTDATLTIAAMAVARSFMQMVISPMHMIRPTVSSLAVDSRDFRKVRSFAITLTIGVSMLLTLFAFSGLARLVFSGIMGVPENVADTAEFILRILCFYPLGLFFKDFYHGLSIRLDRTYLSTLGTLVRIAYLAAVLLVIESLKHLSGPRVAGSIMALAPYIEGLSLLLLVLVFFGPGHRAIDNWNTRHGSGQDSGSSRSPIGTGEIFGFYRPLALTSFITTITAPALNAAIARTSDDPAILAGFAVGWGVTLNMAFPLRLFHQVSIRFAGTDDERRQVLRFGLAFAVLFTAILLLIGFGPLGTIVMETWIGIDTDLAETALSVARVLALLPVITMLKEYLWGILMKNKETGGIGKGKSLSLPVLLSLIVLMNYLFPGNAAVNAATALLITDFFELSVVIMSYRKSSAHIGVNHAMESK